MVVMSLSIPTNERNRTCGGGTSDHALQSNFRCVDRVAETIKNIIKEQAINTGMKWRTLVRLWCGWSTTTRSVIMTKKFEIVYRDPADLIPYE